MEFQEVMTELEALSKERMKKIYMSNGAVEPVFGVATGAMKPMRKIIKKDQELAEQLYATGNYDAMYFAGVIAEPNAMTKEDYNRWMDGAYFYMLSDFVVAVTLAEAEIGQEVADEWINSGDELRMSAGWSSYCWMLGNRKDDQFEAAKIERLLEQARDEIKDAPLRAQLSINNFIFTVGLSYKPMHERALEIADEVGVIEIVRDQKKNTILNAAEKIRAEVEKDRIGFKRKYVRC